MYMNLFRVLYHRKNSIVCPSFFLYKDLQHRPWVCYEIYWSELLLLRLSNNILESYLFLCIYRIVFVLMCTRVIRRICSLMVGLWSKLTGAIYQKHFITSSSYVYWCILYQNPITTKTENQKRNSIPQCQKKKKIRNKNQTKQFKSICLWCHDQECCCHNKKWHCKSAECHMCEWQEH